MNFVTALIPIKARAGCKTRLSECLPEPQRLALVRNMLQHVMQTLQSVSVINRIVVVTPERDTIPENIEILVDEGQDLNSCLTHAVTRLREQGYSRLLILPADLPDLTVADVNHLLNPDGITIAPSEDERGTNGLYLPTDMPFVFEFGENSFNEHCRQLNTLDVNYRVVRSAGLAFDVDTADDYQLYREASFLQPVRSAAI